MFYFSRGFSFEENSESGLTSQLRAKSKFLNIIPTYSNTNFKEKIYKTLPDTCEFSLVLVEGKIKLTVSITVGIPRILGMPVGSGSKIINSPDTAYNFGPGSTTLQHNTRQELT